MLSNMELAAPEDSALVQLLSRWAKRGRRPSPEPQVPPLPASCSSSGGAQKRQGVPYACAGFRAVAHGNFGSGRCMLDGIVMIGHGFSTVL